MWHLHARLARFAVAIATAALLTPPLHAQTDAGRSPPVATASRPSIDSVERADAVLRDVARQRTAVVNYNVDFWRRQL